MNLWSQVDDGRQLSGSLIAVLCQSAGDSVGGQIEFQTVVPEATTWQHLSMSFGTAVGALLKFFFLARTSVIVSDFESHLEG